LMALSLYNMGAIQRGNNQLESSLKSYEQSLEYRTALVAAHPSVTLFRENLGKSYRELARVQYEAHQGSAALSSIQKAIDSFQDLVGSKPDQARYHSELGRSLNLLGFLLDEARDNSRAIQAFRQAVAEQQLAVDKSKDVEEYEVLLCNHLENLGEQFLDLGQVTDALPDYGKVVQLRGKLADAHPANRDLTLVLSQAIFKLGTVQRLAGQPAAAQDAFARARGVLERVKTEPPVDNDSGWIAATFTQEAVALADQGKLEGAQTRLERAVEIVSPRVTPESQDAGEREGLNETFWELARILRTGKKEPEAKQIDARRKALWKGRPPAELIDLTLKQLDRAAQVGYGKTPSSGPAKTIRELDLDQAASNLRLAISHGWNDLAKLKAHSDSDLLLSRDDVKSLIKPLEIPDRPAPSLPKKSS
jgi:tetratricopeptide (TPR) repeat protein